MTPIKIETYADLPEYGTFVLVNGIDQSMYGIRRWHVCEMNDLEDGMDFKEKGQFYWLTESGVKITDVTHWCPTPELEPEFELQFCSTCFQMKNHLNGICQKCKTDNNEKVEIKECEKSPTGKHVFVLPPDSFDAPYCKYCYKE